MSSILEKLKKLTEQHPTATNVVKKSALIASTVAALNSCSMYSNSTGYSEQGFSVGGFSVGGKNGSISIGNGGAQSGYGVIGYNTGYRNCGTPYYANPNNPSGRPLRGTSHTHAPMVSFSAGDLASAPTEKTIEVKDISGKAWHVPAAYKDVLPEKFVVYHDEASKQDIILDTRVYDGIANGDFKPVRTDLGEVAIVSKNLEKAIKDGKSFAHRLDNGELVVLPQELLSDVMNGSLKFDMDKKGQISITEQKTGKVPAALQQKQAGR